MKRLMKRARSGMRREPAELRLVSGRPRESRGTRPGAQPRRAAAPPDEPATPLHIRVLGTALTDRDRAYIRRKLARLDKFASSIVRATVRITDENGPRGGVDVLCTVKVVLRGLPSVVVASRHTRLLVAADDALRNAARTVRRTLARRRLGPIQRPAGARRISS